MPGYVVIKKTSVYKGGPGRCPENYATKGRLPLSKVYETYHEALMANQTLNKIGHRDGYTMYHYVHVMDFEDGHDYVVDDEVGHVVKPCPDL